VNSLRRLCQALLNGEPKLADLAEAEEFLAWLCGTGRPEPAGGFGVPWAVALPEPAEPARRRQALRLLAPALLLDGVWLARAASPATGHGEAESHLLALYTRTVGLDDPAASPPLRFRAALELAGVHLPPLASPEFFKNPVLSAEALVLPAAALYLLHRPRHYFPELLGFTLAWVYREPAWWDASTLGDGQAKDRELAAAALAAWPERAALQARVAAGWNLCRHAFEDLCGAVAREWARDATAEAAVAAIVDARRAEAVGYHGRVRLAGRSLDDWLRESEADARPLLRALRESGRVNRSCPAGSRLVRAMEFGGPMFGVFGEKERQAFLHWIEDPERPVAPESLPAPDAGHCTGPGLPARECARPVPLAGAPGRLTPRQLYLTLLRAESPADCPAAAYRFVDGLLRRTRVLNLLRRGDQLGFPVSPEGFEDYVDALHRREVDRYRPLSGPPAVSREFCRWAVLQLAPAILVDGAWLAGTGTAAEKLGDIGRHLFKTYADELGDGETFRNHPNVYRRLLAAEGLELPPFDSAEFAADGRFLDAAFHIPVYLLVMGLAGERYFPELLGLNLAIELSGLGAGYLRAAELLRFHGMDPAIIDLHLSIDNLASGHAARARDSILLYLDGLRREGRAAVESQWRRIRTGYLSLDTAALGLAAGFAVRYYRERAGLLLSRPGTARGSAA
jgi:hypothetical protein